MKIFKRWTVYDGITGQTIDEKFFFLKDAQDMREAVEFQYVLRGIQNNYIINQDFLNSQIQVVRA